MDKSRRDFLQQAGCGAISAAALAATVNRFGLITSLAQSAGNYRALVCIFMLGGNDGNNSVIPLHSDATLSNYAKYYALRNDYGLAMPQNSLLRA